jgi:hypothetical protein
MRRRELAWVGAPLAAAIILAGCRGEVSTDGSTQPPAVIESTEAERPGRGAEGIEQSDETTRAVQDGLAAMCAGVSVEVVEGEDSNQPSAEIVGAYVAETQDAICQLAGALKLGERTVAAFIAGMGDYNQNKFAEENNPGAIMGPAQGGVRVNSEGYRVFETLEDGVMAIRDVIREAVDEDGNYRYPETRAWLDDEDRVVGAEGELERLIGELYIEGFFGNRTDPESDQERLRENLEHFAAVEAHLARTVVVPAA